MKRLFIILFFLSILSAQQVGFIRGRVNKKRSRKEVLKGDTLYLKNQPIMTVTDNNIQVLDSMVMFPTGALKIGGEEIRYTFEINGTAMFRDTVYIDSLFVLKAITEPDSIPGVLWYGKDDSLHFWSKEGKKTILWEDSN